MVAGCSSVGLLRPRHLPLVVRHYAHRGRGRRVAGEVGRRGGDRVDAAAAALRPLRAHLDDTARDRDVRRRSPSPVPLSGALLTAVTVGGPARPDPPSTAVGSARLPFFARGQRHRESTAARGPAVALTRPRRAAPGHCRRRGAPDTPSPPTTAIAQALPSEARASAHREARRAARRPRSMSGC